MSVLKVRKSPSGSELIYGITYDGTIGIWENFELIAMHDTKLRFIRNASICSEGKLIALCSEMMDEFAVFKWDGKSGFEIVYKSK